MSRIRSKDTRPELLVRRFLYAHGYRYRLHVKRLPGTPDIVMRRLCTIILVNGCFWHGHTGDDGQPCHLFVMPKTRTDFWQSKISRNQERDQLVRRELTSMGWHVIQIWECDLSPAKRQYTLQRLLVTLSQIELHHFAPPQQATTQNTQPTPLDTEEPATKLVADDTELGLNN